MTTTTFDLMNYRPEDGGILDAWCDLYGANWLYVSGYECWYTWNHTHWQKDECQGLQRQIQQLMDAMNQAAKQELTTCSVSNDEDEDNEDKALKRFLTAMISATKRSRGRVASVEGMAQAQRAVAAGMLDAGNVLNLRNGTLDLCTLELRPHNPGDHLTYCLPYNYDPDALAPRFEQFVQEVLVKEDTLEADLELCMLFQELMGYSLTNETQHEVMTWLSGEGGNGKTVAITVMQWLLGNLCCGVDFQSIGLPGNYDIAEIPGRRVIFSTESERGGKLAEGYIKRIVSGERINARAIYGKPFEFKSQAKVWWAMNDKPIIKDTGNAIWRRLKLIPFNRTFTEQDKDTNLLSKLEAELPGILNFALDGLRRLRLRGHFPESKAVQEAVNEYRKESNPTAQWIEERTQPAPLPFTLAGTLYTDYCTWCAQNGRQAMNSNNFSRELTKLKVQRDRKTGGMFYHLALTPCSIYANAT